jgi:splicing factor U2AF subunit
VGHIDGVISTNVPDTDNKLFIGGLPSAFGDADVRDLLQTIGPVRFSALCVFPTPLL